MATARAPLEASAAPTMPSPAPWMSSGVSTTFNPSDNAWSIVGVRALPIAMKLWSMTGVRTSGRMVHESVLK